MGAMNRKDVEKALEALKKWKGDDCYALSHVAELLGFDELDLLEALLMELRDRLPK